MMRSMLLQMVVWPLFCGSVAVTHTWLASRPEGTVRSYPWAPTSVRETFAVAVVLTTPSTLNCTAIGWDVSVAVA